MASSAEGKYYRQPNWALDGVLPEYLPLPFWASRSLLPVSPSTSPVPWPAPASKPGSSPFPDWPSVHPPPQMRPPHEVDPPDKNPYNDPEPNPRNNPAWDPNFLVTEYPPRRTGVDRAGGLLGLLQGLAPGRINADLEPSLENTPQQDIAVPPAPSQTVRILVGRRSRE